jgi:hypothetical protein
MKYWGWMVPTSYDEDHGHTRSEMMNKVFSLMGKLGHICFGPCRARGYEIMAEDYFVTGETIDANIDPTGELAKSGRCL